MIRAGALDSIEKNRSKLLGCYEDILDKMQVSMRHQQEGQVGLFQTLDEDFYSDILESSAFREIPDLELLRHEKELIGDYLSAHPLDGFLKEWQGGVPLADLGESFDKEVVEVVGVLSNVVHRITKTNQPFTMGEIEDFGSKRTFLAFNSPAYPKMIEHIKDDVIVKLKVKVKLRNSEVSLMLEETTLLNHQLVEKVCHVDLLENQSMEQLHEIKQACLMNRGQIPIVFHVQQTVIKTNKKYWIKDTAISVLESILGEQKVWLEN